MCSQETSSFSLVLSGTGDVVTEDGRNRCPFNPEYKSTAIVAGMLYKMGMRMSVSRFI